MLRPSLLHNEINDQREGPGADDEDDDEEEPLVVDMLMNDVVTDDSLLVSSSLFELTPFDSGTVIVLNQVRVMARSIACVAQIVGQERAGRLRIH